MCVGSVLLLDTIFIYYSYIAIKGVPYAYPRLLVIAIPRILRISIYIKVATLSHAKNDLPVTKIRLSLTLWASYGV